MDKKTKRTPPKGNRLEEIRAELVATMESVSIDPTPYRIAIAITAETLLERENAYKEYIENGSRQTEEGARASTIKSNPYATRLCSWNAQARACLSMLKLTPVRVVEKQEDSVTDNTM